MLAAAGGRAIELRQALRQVSERYETGQGSSPADADLQTRLDRRGRLPPNVKRFWHSWPFGYSGRYRRQRANSQLLDPLQQRFRRARPRRVRSYHKESKICSAYWARRCSGEFDIFPHRDLEAGKIALAFEMVRERKRTIDDRLAHNSRQNCDTGFRLTLVRLFDIVTLPSSALLLRYPDLCRRPFQRLSSRCVKPRRCRADRPKISPNLMRRLTVSRTTPQHPCRPRCTSTPRRSAPRACALRSVRGRPTDCRSCRRDARPRSRRR